MTGKQLFRISVGSIVIVACIAQIIGDVKATTMLLWVYAAISETSNLVQLYQNNWEYK